VRTVDKVKIAVLAVAIAIWAAGARMGNRSLMLTGIGLVIVAFALRLIPKSGDGNGR